MTTVTVTATAPGESPVTTTSSIGSDNRFTAGEFPVADDVQLGVVLRDVSNRIVGVGEAGQTIDIVGNQETAIAIPVRRPFVYASSGTALFSFDPTLDPRDGKFQGKLAGVTAPLFTISVGGDRLAVVSSSAVQIVVTATNTVTGMIPIPAGVTVTDATTVPGTHQVVIAHNQGISIADIDAATIQTIAVGAIDRVSAGRASDGALYAYGLIGRVAPPEKPGDLSTCMGSSSIVAINMDAPAPTQPLLVGAAVSDLAAAPDQSLLFATLPCAGKVVKLVGVLELGTLSMTDVSPLERAAVLTVAGDRIWAAGTQTSTPQCTSTCTPTTQILCPQGGSSNRLLWVTAGASVIVKSIPLIDDGDQVTLTVPARRETIIDTDDTAKQHAQVLKALGVVPLDLVALPGGQYVGLVTKSRYFIEEAGGVLPCLDVNTADWLLIDMASSSVAQRVRTSCTEIVGPGLFANWECEQPPDGERLAPTIPDYVPSSVGALFGAR
jgi:hypothetical protein